MRKQSTAVGPSVTLASLSSVSLRKRLSSQEIRVPGSLNKVSGVRERWRERKREREAERE